MNNDQEIVAAIITGIFSVVVAIITGYFLLKSKDPPETRQSIRTPSIGPAPKVLTVIGAFIVAFAAVHFFVGRRSITPTPILGDWSLDTRLRDQNLCPESLEMTPTMLTGSIFGVTQSHPVTYSQDGSNYLATVDGSVTTFVIEGDGITTTEPLRCHYVRPGTITILPTGGGGAVSSGDAVPYMKAWCEQELQTYKRNPRFYGHASLDMMRANNCGEWIRIPSG